MPIFNEGRIHILKGTGDNCSCNDCVVLYGGDCYTTPYNNFLDDIELKINKFLSFTPTGKPKKVSDNYIDQSIEFIKNDVCKFLCINSKKFYDNYYLFLPLIFIMTSDKKAAKKFYKRTRLNMFTNIKDEITK